MTVEFTNWFKWGFLIYSMQMIGFVITHIISVCCSAVFATNNSTSKMLLEITQGFAGFLLSISMGFGKIIWVIYG